MEVYLFYILLYIAVVGSILIYSGFTNNKSKICFFAFVVLYLFSAFRYDVGWDYFPYVADMTEGTVQRYEPLARLLLTYCGKINQPQLFFFITDFVVLWFMMLTIKRYSPNTTVSILIFACFPFLWLMGLSTVRSAVVLSIIFFAYFEFLHKHKIIQYIVCVLVCFLIQKGALFALILIPLEYLKVGRFGNIVILILAFVMERITVNYDTVLNLVVDRLGLDQYYLVRGGQIGGQSAVHYVFLGISLFNLLFYNRLVRLNENTAKYISFICWGYFTYSFFIGDPVLSSRMSRFFYVFCVILLPYYMSIFRIQDSKLIKSIIVSICFVMLIIQLSLPNYNGIDPNRYSTYWPYKTFLFKNL